MNITKPSEYLISAIEVYGSFSTIKASIPSKKTGLYEMMISVNLPAFDTGSNRLFDKSKRRKGSFYDSFQFKK